MQYMIIIQRSVLGQDTVTLASGIGPESGLGAEDSVQQGRLVLPPGDLHFSAQLVKSLGNLTHLISGCHLGKVAIKVFGQDLT